MYDIKPQFALVSVYNKNGLAPLIEQLHSNFVKIISTGGTKTFIESLNIPVIAVEDLTHFPEILGGRVKTLHPHIFGGILNRRSNTDDQAQINQHEINHIDLVIVDLYPFEDTVKSNASEEDIIEKIDVGGISLIRAAAKNFNDVAVISSTNTYEVLLNELKNNNGAITYNTRKMLAKKAFANTSYYDACIFNYFNQSNNLNTPLRYGENPHQKGWYQGKLNDVFEKLSGKELSYNNLLDVDAALNLIYEFENETTFAVIKHNNACGVASANTLLEAWQKALAGDPESAFGGVLVCNSTVDVASANEINKLFFEIILAPNFDAEAIKIFTSKPNRILLKYHPIQLQKTIFRSILNGTLWQDRDTQTESEQNLTCVTDVKPSKLDIEDLLYANKIAKQSKSNTIVLVKNKQLLASGCGQTSRVDALRHAIIKAQKFNFNLKGAVMASDAFFPFADCVEIAHSAGIQHIIQPGGSIKDQLTIDYCKKNNLSMVITGVRHFKH